MISRKIKILAPVALVTTFGLGATPATAGDGVEDEAAEVVSDELALIGTEPGDPKGAPEAYYRLRTGPFNDHPEQWGGAYIDNNRLVVLYTNQDVDSAERAINALDLGDVNIDLKQAEHSMSDLLNTVDILSNKLADVTDTVVSVGPQYSENRLLVGVKEDHIDKSLASQILEHADEQEINVEFFQTTPSSPDSSRYAYEPPFYGGALIMPTGTTQTTCSSAFAWENGSTHYMLTAAHCLDSPDSQGTRYTIMIPMLGGGVPVAGTVDWTSGHTYGTSVGREGDVARYPIDSWASVTNRIWTGNGDSSTSRAVFVPASLPENWEGENLRTSGASGATKPNRSSMGEAKPDRITFVDRTLTYDNGQIWTGLTSGTSSSTCTNKGDSGGAWYLKSGSAAQAVGVHSGSKNPLLGPCEMHYTPIHSFENQTGGDLLGSS